MRLQWLVRTELVLAMTLGAAPTWAEPHNVVLFVPDGLRARSVDPGTRAGDGGGARRAGRQFPQSPFALPDLHHGQRLGDGDRPLPRRHRRFQQHDLCRHPGRGGRRRGDALPRERRRARRGRRAFRAATISTRRRSSPRRARRGFGTAAIGKLGPVLIFDHTDRSGAPSYHHRRRDRQRHRHSAGARARATRCRRGPAARDARPRRQRQVRRRRRRPARRVANIDAAGLFRRRRDQGGAAAAQGARQAVRAGVLVARSRRHAAQSGRQPRRADARHQRPDLAAPRSGTPTTISRASEAALDALGLAATTDIIVAADHGFSTISKESKTSPAAHGGTRACRRAQLPPGFLALDLAAALEPAALRSQRQERARSRTEHFPKARQRPHRQRSGASRCRRRRQWRLGPGLSAEARQGARAPRRRGAAAAGLCQRALRR